MIQIASGFLRGLQLKSPQGKQTRPSGERLRQGTFNVLRSFRWEAQSQTRPIAEGAVVADLFSGSGAWGIEALSNGAERVVFVENHPAALRALTANLAIAARALQAQGRGPGIDVVRLSAERAYGKLPQARVLFADPPYRCGWWERLCRLEERAGRVCAGGVVLFEADARESLDLESLPASAGLKLFNSKIYGDSVVHFFVKTAHASQGHLSG